MTKKKQLFTWNEWKAIGFRIIAGEKSCGRNCLGIPVFDEDQVTEFAQMTFEEAEAYGYDEQNF